MGPAFPLVTVTIRPSQLSRSQRRSMPVYGIKMYHDVHRPSATLVEDKPRFRTGCIGLAPYR